MKTLNLALAGLLLSAAPLLAQELVMSSWLPPKHPIVVNALEPWAADVEKATEGRVSVRITGKPLGTPENESLPLNEGNPGSRDVVQADAQGQTVPPDAEGPGWTSGDAHQARSR